MSLLTASNWSDSSLKSKQKAEFDSGIGLSQKYPFLRLMPYSRLFLLSLYWRYVEYYSDLEGPGLDELMDHNRRPSTSAKYSVLFWHCEL